MEREEKPNVLYVQMFSTFYSASKDIQRLLTSLKIKGVFLDIFIDEPKKKWLTEDSTANKCQRQEGGI